MGVHYLHTKLRVSDLDRGIAFYQQAFGYVLRKRKDGPNSSLIAFLALPGEETELQLAFYPNQGAFEVPNYLMHLAFRVDNLQAVIDSARSAGAIVLSDPYVLPSGSQVAFIRDPDGHEIELIEKPQSAS